MERYLEIEKVNLKHNLLLYVLTAVSMCCLSPLVMGVKNLDERQTAAILEIFMSLMGIILLIPVFMPDIMQDIRQLIQSKKMPVLGLHILRYIEALIFLAVIILVYMQFLKSGECVFPFWKLFYGTLANCIFLGGLGLLFFSIYNNIVAAYMVPALFYILSYGGGAKVLGKFYLFSMMRGSFEEKKYLLVLGVLLTVISLAYRQVKHRFE